MLLRLALRNLWRNRRRTLLTLSAMIVATALLILALGVFSGMFRDMLSSATEQYHGHIVISQHGYQDERDLYTTFSATAPWLAALDAVPEIVARSLRLRSFGLLGHEAKSRPAELLGIDPAAEAQVTTLAQNLTAGVWPTTTDGRWAVLGSGLAKRLGVVPGDELVFVTSAADGTIGNDLLVVAALFTTGGGQDNSLALVPLPWLQQVAALPGQVHEVALRVRQPLTAAPLAAQLRTLLPPSLEILDWGALLPEMREAIASYDVSRMIMATILYLAAGLGILNTFYMAVVERTREFGLLMALGMRPRTIRLLVLGEAFCTGLFALIIGIVFALFLTWLMQRYGIDLSSWMSPVTYAGGTIPPRLHAILDPVNFITPSWLLLLVSLLAGVLPANRAARFDPARALRED